ncbi:MAG: hypothetical protein ACK4G4_12525, partial [Thermus sp.]|uniref:hypothetical protein n=1 Tax=Thermus sp. TaxID=275 RepID=UPI00391927BD
ALFLASSLGARFAAFSVEPFGTQRVNLDTGVTTLPQGGILVETTNGVRIEAQYIEYKPASFILAKEAELLIKEILVRGRELNLDLVSQKISIKSFLLKKGPFANLSADEAYLFAEESILLMRGNITLVSPELHANLAVINLRTQQALIIGPFSYQGKKERDAGSRLFLYLEGSTIKGTSRIPRGVSALEAWTRRMP